MVKPRPPKRRPAKPSFDLQAAIDACPPGGVVRIPAGTWTVNDTVVLKSDITIEGEGDTSVIRLLGGTDWTRVLYGKGLRNVILRKFKVDGNASVAKVTGSGEQRHCIFLSGCMDCLIEKVTVTQSLGDGIFLYGGCERITVQDCVATAGKTANPRVGINFQGANNSIVRRNRVEGYFVGYKAEIDSGDEDSIGNQILSNICKGTKLALGLNGSTTGRAKQYVVQNNQFEASGDQCIWISRADNIVVWGNTLSGGSMGVYLPFDAHVVRVENNLLNQPTGICIRDYGGRGPCSAVKIYANEFKGAQKVVAVYESASDVEVSYNKYPSTATLVYNANLVAGLNVHDNEVV